MSEGICPQKYLPSGKCLVYSSILNKTHRGKHTMRATKNFLRQAKSPIKARETLGDYLVALVVGLAFALVALHAFGALFI